MDTDFWSSMFVLLKRQIEGQQIGCCVKNPLNRPLTQLFVLQKHCPATKIQYYLFVSWFLIPMTGNFMLVAHTHVDIKKIQILFCIDIFHGELQIFE